MACFSSRVENLLTKRIDEEDELQKDFSHSRQHRFRCMRQLMSFRRTSHFSGSTDVGAHASICELQKDFFRSRQHRFRCTFVNLWALPEELLLLKASQVHKRLFSHALRLPFFTALLLCLFLLCSSHSPLRSFPASPLLFSHSREHRFRCACVNLWASERLLQLNTAQTHAGMRQLLRFRKTSSGCTDSGAYVPSNRVTSSSCYNFVRVLQNFWTGLLSVFVKILHF